MRQSGAGRCQGERFDRKWLMSELIAGPSPRRSGVAVSALEEIMVVAGLVAGLCWALCGRRQTAALEALSAARGATPKATR